MDGGFGFGNLLTGKTKEAYEGQGREGGRGQAVGNALKPNFFSSPSV